MCVWIIWDLIKMQVLIQYVWDEHEILHSYSWILPADQDIRPI